MILQTQNDTIHHEQNLVKNFLDSQQIPVALICVLIWGVQ